MNVPTLHAKSILTKSSLPGVDYVINPYTGCTFSCLYCYACFMSRSVNKAANTWGSYVYIKENAALLTERDLPRIIRNAEKKGLPYPNLLFSSVTDAWQYIEKKCEVTRTILKVLARHHYPGCVSTLTKSPLIVRDSDLFKQLPNTKLGMTITSAENAISQFFEQKAPPVTERLKALEALNKEGFNTYVFIGPVFPHLLYNIEELEKLFRRIQEAGTRNLYVEHLNLAPQVQQRMMPLLSTAPQSIRDLYLNPQLKKSAKKTLTTYIDEFVKRYHFHLLHKVIEHE